MSLIATALMLIGWATLKPRALPFGAGDAALGLLLAGLGTWLGSLAARGKWTDAGAIVFASVAAIALSEGGARLLLDRPLEHEIPMDIGSTARLAPAPCGPMFGMGYLHPYGGTAAAACTAAYPEIDYTTFRTRTRGLTKGPVILHLGDSILEGSGVGGAAPGGRTFVSLLDSMDRANGHVNAGISGSGPEIAAMVERNWTKRLPVKGIVSYLFLENDLADLDTPYPCCGFGELWAWDGDRMAPRCEKARFPPILEQWVMASSNPWVLRTAADDSYLARLILARIERAVRNLLGVDYILDDTPDQWSRMKGILGAMASFAKDRDIPFRVVVLPVRSEMETRDPGCKSMWRSRRKRVGRMLSRLGIESMDARHAFDESDRPPDAWFISMPDGSPDDHFNEAGHARFARWLYDRGLDGLIESRDTAKESEN